MTSLRAATVTVSDLAGAVSSYERWLGYKVLEEGAVPRALAEAWGAPGAAGRPMSVLGPESGAETFLRFVEAPAAEAYAPLTSFGWAALELCIQDALGTNERLGESPFRVIGPPRPNPGLSRILPMQVEGPDREVLFLTQTQIGGPSDRHPVARSSIDELFIAVYAARDMAGTAAWFGAVLGLEVEPAMSLPYRVLSEAFGLPPDHVHRLTTLVSGRRALLEIDDYPEGATDRPRTPGQLPPGVVIVSFASRGLASKDVVWLDGRADGPIYKGGRVGVARAPEGALVEIIDES